MVTCSSCGSSSGVQIERQAPASGTAAPDGVRWTARCEECGAVWTIVD